MGIGAAIGSVVGGIAQGRAASKAAKAQQATANRQIALQERIYDENTERFEPWVGAGNNALSAFMYEMGLGEAPTVGGSTPEITEALYDSQGNPFTGARDANDGVSTRFQVGGQVFDTRDEAQAYANENTTGGTIYGGYQASPDNLFRIQQGIAGVDASAAARGGLYSGATMQAANDRAIDIASLGRDNYLNRLMGVSNAGQAAAGQGAAAGQNFANGASNALANLGNAQAAGAIGQGNAITGTINNLTGLYQYQNLQSGNQGGQSGGWLGNLAFGGGGNWLGGW